MLYLVALFLATLYASYSYLYRSYALRKPKGEKKFVALNVGHRGCRRFRNYPENTLKAFDFAIQHGADAIELDCRLTKDNQVVVIHDDNLERLCGRAGWVSEMTWEQLKAIPVLPAPVVEVPAEDGYKPSSVMATLKSKVNGICLLEDVLKLAGKSRGTANPVKVFVEIKSTSFDSKEARHLARSVAKVMKETNSIDYACVISFSPLVLYHTRVAAPEIECCMLYCEDFLRSTVSSNAERYPFWLPFVYRPLDILLKYLCKEVLPEFIGCTMVGPDVNLLCPADIKAFRRRGLEIYAWVVNTPADAAWCLRHGISYGTDAIFPELLTASSGQANLPLTSRMAQLSENALRERKYAPCSTVYDYDGMIAKAVSDSKYLQAGSPPAFTFTSERVSKAAVAAAAVVAVKAAAVVSTALVTAAATVASATAASVPTSAQEVPRTVVPNRNLEDSDSEGDVVTVQN